MISSVEANRSGTYCSEVERPKAPSFIAWATAFSIAASSAAVAGRSLSPITRFRTPPAPTKVPRLIAGRARSNACQYWRSVVQLGLTP